MVELSATIVVYDNYDEAKEAVGLLEEYTSKDLTKTIYVVDNGKTTNDTDSFCDFLKQYSDVQYIRPETNLGFGKGHNLVLNCLDSKYHTIVNPDIKIQEDVFSKIVKWMDENKEVGMVIPDIHDEQGNRQLVYRKDLTIFDSFNRFFCHNAFKQRARAHTLQDKDYSKPFQVPFGQGSFLVIRTNLFKKLNGFDENFFMYCEDADLCRRVNLVSKLMYYPDAIVIHKWNKASHKNFGLFRKHLQSQFYYFKKWGFRWR